MRVPFYFTYVTYTKGDWLGYFLAIISLVPHVLTIVLFSFLVTIHSSLRRPLAKLLVGEFVNEALNYLLKVMIREPRKTMERVDYAMPSSHSQYATYIAVTGWVFLKRLGNKKFRLLGRLICIGVFFVVPFSRYYLDYHDLRQVLVGMSLGVMFGLGWNTLFLLN